MIVYIVQYGAWRSKKEDDRVLVAELTSKKDVIKMYKDHIKKYKGRETNVDPTFAVWRGTRLSIKPKKCIETFELANFDHDYNEEHNRYNLPDIIMDEED